MNKATTEDFKQAEQPPAAPTQLSAVAPDPEMLVAIANERIKAGDVPNALAMLAGAIDLNADCFNAYTNLTGAAARAGHFNAALACARRAVAIRPDSKEALSNLGINLWRLGFYAEARSTIAKAWDLDHDAPGINHNAGLIYYALGDAASAIAHLQRALEADPENKQIVSDLALATLKSGKLHEGLVLHEVRWTHFIAKSPVWDCGVPMWAGEPLDLMRCKIVLHHEQGQGDTMQFIRFLPVLMEKYPRATVRVLVPDAQLTLMQHSFRHLGPSIFGNLDKPGDIVRAMNNADYHCPLLSLVKVLGTEFGTLPKAAPYLAAPTSPGAARPLNTPGTKVSVGVIWSASVGHIWSRMRSVPIKQIMRLAEVPGVRLYSLQVGEYAKELNASGANAVMADLVPTIRNFADTAAYMQQLDLIISVDSAAAHLAGALGKPVWMFNPFTPCWRWCEGPLPWYKTMEHFDQTEANDDWSDVITIMQGLLSNMVHRS